MPPLTSRPRRRRPPSIATADGRGDGPEQRAVEPAARRGGWACGSWPRRPSSAVPVRRPTVDHLAGALVLTWSVIAFGEIVRPVRLFNVLIGLGVAAAPWLLSGTTDASRWNDVVVGIAVVMLSLPRGRIQQQFGDWNRYLVL